MLEVIPIIVPVSSSLKSINFYLAKTNNSLLLVDAGLNQEIHWEALIRTLHSNHLDLHDLTHILLTHHHGDHVGLVNRIVSANPVPVYAHPLSFPRLKRDKDFMQMRIQFFEELYRKMGCGEAGRKQVEHLKKAADANQGLRLECELYEVSHLSVPGIDVVDIPGHAPDQIAFFDQTKGQIISGDLLIQHISSNALVEPDRNGNRIPSLSTHVQSLKKCLDFPITTVYPGHGQKINHPGDLINKRLAGTERKAERFLSLLKEGTRTANEVAKTYYGDMYNKQFSLVMSEVIGHLDYLEELGKVERLWNNGMWKYQVV